jgi:hypothetical protein
MAKPRLELVHRRLDAAKPRRTWSVEWQGRLTRAIGWDQEIAATAPLAWLQYAARYPMRQVRAVTLVDPDPGIAT